MACALRHCGAVKRWDRERFTNRSDERFHSKLVPVGRVRKPRAEDTAEAVVIPPHRASPRVAQTSLPRQVTPIGSPERSDGCWDHRQNGCPGDTAVVTQGMESATAHKESCNDLKAQRLGIGARMATRHMRNEALIRAVGAGIAGEGPLLKAHIDGLAAELPKMRRSIRDGLTTRLGSPAKAREVLASLFAEDHEAARMAHEAWSTRIEVWGMDDTVNLALQIHFLILKAREVRAVGMAHISA